MPKSKRNYLIVEHRNYRVLDEKNKIISELRNQIAQLRRQLNRAEMDYGSEVYINSYLIDILKKHHIPFNIPR